MAAEEVVDLDLEPAPEAGTEGQIDDQAIAAFKARYKELLVPLESLAEDFFQETGVVLKPHNGSFDIQVFRGLLNDFQEGEDTQRWLGPIELVQAQIEALFESIIAEYGEGYIKKASEDGKLSGEIIGRVVGNDKEDADNDFAGIVRAELANDVSLLVRRDFWIMLSDLSENYHPGEQLKALPGFEIAAQELEAEVSAKLQGSIVPAVASLNRHRVASAVSATAIAAPINFWAISTWFNEGIRLGFGTSFLIFILGNLAGFAIPTAIAHLGSEKFNKSMDNAAVPSKRGVAETGILSGDKFGHKAHGKRLMNLAGKAPQEFLDALAETVGGKVNYLRITTLLLVLGIALPYPIDKLITEPAEQDVGERVSTTAEKAAKEFAARLPQLSVDEVRKELSGWGSKPLTLDRNSVRMGSDFILPGDDCETTSGYGADEHSVSYSKTLKAWVSKDSNANGEATMYNVILPTSDDWNLSDSEAEECFHTEEPDFGAKIVVARSSNGEWVIKSFSHLAIQDQKAGLKVTPIEGSETHGAITGGNLARITDFIKALNQDQAAKPSGEKEVKKKPAKKKKRK